MTVVKALPRYQDTGHSVLAWAIGIANRKVSESWRARGRRSEICVDDLPERADGVRPAEPESEYLSLESSAAVAALLARLPHPQGEILRLRIAVGLSADETAEVLGMSAGAIRVAQHRALARLRAVVTREESRDRRPRPRDDRRGRRPARRPRCRERQPGARQRRSAARVVARRAGLRRTVRSRPCSGRRRGTTRARRFGSAAVAPVVLLTGGGVAAAAVSGPNGPLGGLHRVLFGSPRPSDPVPARVGVLARRRAAHRRRRHARPRRERRAAAPRRIRPRRRGAPAGRRSGRERRLRRPVADAAGGAVGPAGTDPARRRRSARIVAGARAGPPAHSAGPGSSPAAPPSHVTKHRPVAGPGALPSTVPGAAQDGPGRPVHHPARPMNPTPRRPPTRPDRRVRGGARRWLRRGRARLRIALGAVGQRLGRWLRGRFRPDRPAGPAARATTARATTGRRRVRLRHHRSPRRAAPVRTPAAGPAGAAVTDPEGETTAATTAVAAATRVTEATAEHRAGQTWTGDDHSKAPAGRVPAAVGGRCAVQGG